jgi:predicted transposase YbfD/YdcC
MCYSRRSSFRQHLSDLKRQFLQDGELPLANVLSEESVSQALHSKGDDEAIYVRPAIRSGISSLKMGVKQFTKAIRSHWQIETPE